MDLIFEEIDSTNDYCKRHLDTLEHFSTVQALFQSKGRGRREHEWQSEKNENLLLSMVIKKGVEGRNIHQLTQVVAYAVVLTLQEYGIDAKIKWPNDIYVDDQKICGILLEGVFGPKLCGVVMGIGCNVNTMNYQSIKQILGRDIPVAEVKSLLISKLIFCYQQYENKQYPRMLESINSIAYLKDKWIDYGKYGVVSFRDLQEDGRVKIVNQENEESFVYINDISLQKNGVNEPSFHK